MLKGIRWVDYHPWSYGGDGLLNPQTPEKLALGFAPTARLDGNNHQIEIRVRGLGVQVRQSRAGYYPGVGIGDRLEF